MPPILPLPPPSPPPLEQKPLNPTHYYLQSDINTIDCEMVGVGYNGIISELARVSIVNYYGVTLMDKYVKPKQKVTDYRTQFTCDFKDIHKEVKDLMEGNLVIGQSLGFDFNVLKLYHPISMVRDTSYYYHIIYDVTRQLTTPSLKKLAREVLGLEIQEKTHDSAEDAKTCMLLYRLKQDEWEIALKTKKINIVLNYLKEYLQKSKNALY
ncbi:7368_t:CDS:2 [Entrophospora sp. SA101]|nr:7368_t:CDS:2 [Entrophospora sp. SA101]